MYLLLYPGNTRCKNKQPDTISHLTNWKTSNNVNVLIPNIMNSMKLVIPLHLIVLVNSHQRWKQTRNRVCFHLWCELTLALWCHSIIWSLLFHEINVTEWQVSWNSWYLGYFGRHLSNIHWHHILPLSLSLNYWGQHLEDSTSESFHTKVLEEVGWRSHEKFQDIP